MARKQAERPVVAPTFGALLTELRSGNSRGEICTRLTHYGLTLDRSTLLQYERGTVGSPSPTVLWGLSKIYQISLDKLLNPLLRDLGVNRALVPPEDAVLPDAEQRQIAELSACLSTKTRQALMTILRELVQPSVRHR